nr:uncharacterized protein LOC125421532 [Ziziphus jujuba var. spinosa]
MIAKQDNIASSSKSGSSMALADVSNLQVQRTPLNIATAVKGKSQGYKAPHSQGLSFSKSTMNFKRKKDRKQIELGKAGIYESFEENFIDGFKENMESIALDLKNKVEDLASDMQAAYDVVVLDAILMETQISGLQADRCIARIDWNKVVKVDPIGFSRGIWLLWKDELLDIDQISLSNQMVNVIINHTHKGKWFFTALYASPISNVRNKLWSAIKEISKLNKFSWLLVGDFSYISSPLEKKRGMEVNISTTSGLHSLIQDCCLIDLGAVGPKFIWCNGRICNACIKEMLDKVFCSIAWKETFPNVIVHNLPRSRSNHHPILIKVEPNSNLNSHLKPFRFEMAWMLHPQFSDLVSAGFQNTNGLFLQKINSFKYNLKRWNREHLISKLNVVLEQEEFLWKHKSQCQWLQSGHRNTKYFHLTTLIRRRRNKVDMLKNNKGIWISEKEVLKNIVISFFENLYSCENASSRAISLPNLFPRIEDVDLRELNKPIEDWEIRNALFNISPWKALRKDGFPVALYQQYWHFLGLDICLSAFAIPFTKSLVRLLSRGSGPS